MNIYMYYCVLFFLQWLFKYKTIKLYEGNKPTIKNANDYYYFPPANLDFENIDTKLVNIVKNYWESFISDMALSITKKETAYQKLQHQFQQLMKQHSENAIAWEIVNQSLATICEPVQLSKAVRELHVLEKKNAEIEKQCTSIQDQLTLYLNDVKICRQILEISTKQIPTFKYNNQPKCRYITVKFVTKANAMPKRTGRSE